MLELKYLNSNEIYQVNFSQRANNICELIGDFPIRTDGFLLSRKNMDDIWDYSDYTTVYREIEGGVQFSNDGSVYLEPEPVAPYVPTLEEVQESKVFEMNDYQQKTIQNGVDVVLSDGTVEHFTLTDHDQQSLTALQAQVESGNDKIPWHNSNQAEHCKYYSNADMSLIVTSAMTYVTFHVTYFRDLRIYIRSLKSKEEVDAVFYGMNIPEEYQSAPLKDMLLTTVV